jgi:serine/threonine protein kinase
MAVVYRALDTLLDRSVAIKIIIPEKNDKGKLLRRFNREAKTLAKLSHVNIVKVLDYGEYQSSPYLVLEFIPGGTLKEKVGTPWNYTEAAAMLAPLARALNYAHNQKVIHRDIKPANILINESGQPLLSDFGILKLMDAEETQGLTGTGKVVGTPAYMSPEQIRGKEVDGRADIYSLGVIFFEMITGKKPYTANTPIEISMKHLNEPVPRAKQIIRDLPSDVEQVLVKALAKNPEDRFQSMAAFADALDKLFKKQASASNRASTTITNEFNKPVEEKKTRTPKWLFAAVPLTILLGLGTFFFFQQGNTNPAVTLAGAAGAEEQLMIETATINPPTETAQPTSTTTTIPTLPPSPTPTEYALTLAQSPTPPEPGTLIEFSNVSKIVEINRLEKTSVIRLDWMENGHAIVNVGSNGIWLIDPKTMKEIKKISLTNEIPISMAVSPANDKLFVLFDVKVKVYDLQSLDLLQEFSITGGAFSIASSQDGKMIALGILDNKVQLINAEDGRVLRNLKSNYGGWSVAFSPDSSIVAGGTSQGSLMWESGTGIWLPLSGGQSSLIKSLAFSQDGNLLAGGSQGVIYIWDVTTGNIKTQIKSDIGNINSLDFSPDGNILVSGSDDSLIRLWNVSSGKILVSLKGHTSPVFGVVFSPSGKFIVSGANEGVIRMWGIP